jgi:hypothetical protein
MTTPEDEHHEITLQEQPELPPRPQETHTPPPEVHGPEEHVTQPTEPVNPAIAPLKAMFPDFDDAVLQSVLDSVNGDQDAAVDVLLGMSDPGYVSTQHHEVCVPQVKIMRSLTFR